MEEMLASPKCFDRGSMFAFALEIFYLLKGGFVEMR
jgi:hypothetical protein